MKSMARRFPIGERRAGACLDANEPLRSACRKDTAIHGGIAMYVNHNAMATNVANTLTSHYGNLQTSTQRLSSGLRINSAADDAAGLAIRELMRTDIAALQQGVRNANDAISLIQTADGALGVIDEKLTRMKELAEQAATGTYDSTQRLMIESEYQAMASEITRIANATDFNGIKLLDGNLSSDKHDGSGLTATGKLKVHFGTANDSAEDYYYIKIGECTAQALGVGNASTWEDTINRAVATFADTLRNEALAYDAGDDVDKIAARNALLATDIDTAIADFKAKLTAISTNAGNATDLWKPTDANEKFAEDGKKWTSASSLMEDVLADPTKFSALSDREKQKLEYAWGKAALYSYANVVHDGNGTDRQYGMSAAAALAEFGADNAGDIDEADRQAMLDAALKAAFKATENADYAGYSIATQEDAQDALVAINSAIVQKDKVRADLGAMQNRLENTVSNLTIQAENLQASESRISDVDVATEMTQFVRNQILTQSAVAMLSQANSMPQMAMQLIGG